MRISVLAASLPLLLGACATGADFDTKARSLSDFTVADLKAANELAVAAGDEKAKACYPALIEYVESLQGYRDITTEAEKVEGAFVVYQRARNIRRALDVGVPESVEIHCASLLNDSRGFLGRLLGRVGVKVLIP